MDRALDLQPSLEYIQWYFEMGKSYLFGGQLMVVPSHMTQLGQPSHPLLYPPPAPEPEPEPELHSGDSSYHLDLGGNDYFLGSSSHRYHSEFDIFSPLPLQYSTPSGQYPSQYSTLPA
ncbi:hypothetical protein PVK06_028010 [Gossypium arboreum]|uniref:Uncharacterized protein n=1 Tax=Gossypium arboreum TaxID=29729 RepID=A0ABR0P359_GOSAR|nr:hypothetical protein PVK06_028010 [Gossypium arboreum]